MTRVIKAIVFDYNVLVNHDNRKVSAILGTWSSQKLSSDQIHHEVFDSPKLSIFERGEIPHESFYNIVMSAILAMDKKPTLAEFSDLWGNVFSQRNNADNMLERLHVPDAIFLMGNVDKIRSEHLRQIPAIDTFFEGQSRLILSCDNKSRMPEIGLCSTAIKRTRCVPSEILYVGTNLKYTERFERCGTDILLHDPQQPLTSLIKELRAFNVL
ncbi:MAG: hypothetical protein AAB552_03735 [Patescibacteria group bacterium]|mgnify:CR=1 FL=1